MVKKSDSDVQIFIVCIGYDASQGKYVDMIKAGIVDPVKVVRTGLVDASGVASLLTTTECMIVDAPAKEGAAGPANPMGYS